MKKNFEYAKEYQYKGYYIYRITRKDYCVWGNDGYVMIDATTLKSAKAEIDKLV